MDKFYHSVRLDPELCKGCINCIKRCPTEAIRVRGGKAQINSKFCIDCGECIRVCPHHAKHAVYDKLDVLKDYEYTVALPAPSLYSQFNNLDDVNIVLAALVMMGFDDVFEVSAAAELVSEATRRYIETHQEQLPIISTACPSVVQADPRQVSQPDPAYAAAESPDRGGSHTGGQEGYGEDRPAKREDRHHLHIPLPVQGDLCEGRLWARRKARWTMCWPSRMCIRSCSACMKACGHRTNTRGTGDVRQDRHRLGPQRRGGRRAVH